MSGKEGKLEISASSLVGTSWIEDRSERTHTNASFAIGACSFIEHIVSMWIWDTAKRVSTTPGQAGTSHRIVELKHAFRSMQVFSE